MFINAYSIPIWISVIFIASLATVTFWGSKKDSARAFAFSIFMVTIYNASIAFFMFEKNFGLADFGVKFTFFMGLVVASSVFYFIKSVTTDKRPGAGLTTAMVIIAIIAFYFIFFTNSITNGAIALKEASVADMVWGWSSGQFAYIFYTVVVGYYLLSLRILSRARKAAMDVVTRKNITHTIAGLLIGVLSHFIFNSILPAAGNYNLVWVGPTMGIVWVSIIAYSIVKYHQMSVKVIAAEVLVIAMSIAAFINIFVGDLMGIGGKVFIFLAFFVLGTYLIRGAVHESEQREQLDELNRDLQKKVDEQTKEIRASYQIEHNANIELGKVDQAKNQFILITQHHLRTPITSIKWQLEAILSGTYGPVAPELRKAMGDMSESVGRLNHLIDNLLSISALRSGIESLNKSPTSLRVVADDIIAELKKEIDRKHLILHLPLPKEVWPALSVDKDRIREALFVVIENAVRYNIEGGSIFLSGQATENTFEFVVENTGAELTSDDKEKIFSELFYRSSQAQVAHPTGMGIGLSMAQAIIEAHKGTISLGSRKEAGGVRVVVTLPY